MPSGRQDAPASWTAFERGGRQNSSDSLTSGNRVTFDEEIEDHHRTPGSDDSLSHAPQGPGRRRSSMALRMQSLRQAGGVNSFDNFAASWQRAAGFFEVTPVRPSFRYTDEGEHGEEENYERGAVEDSPREHRSLLRAALQEGRSDEAVFDEEDRSPLASPERPTQSAEARPILRERESRVHEDNIFSIEPQLASPFGGSYGSTWGSLASRVNEPSMRHAGRLFQKQQLTGVSAPDKEREPLLVKQVQDGDGKVVNVIVGQSTLPQTCFNSVNVLIGVGLLALPYSFRLSGWVPGLIFFIFAGVSTSYTAKLLAKCADVDNSLITFADLAYVSFGLWARLFTSCLFILELVGANVALVIIFSDSLDALLPGWGVTEWKIVCGLIISPLSFLPLRLLSFTSILGILSCFGIVLAILVDGLIKGHAPGSLREPATTYLFPSNWLTLPIAFGILMSPWGGASVMPSIYRDMRHPYKYRRSVNITWSFTFVLDLFMAVSGYLMFGEDVKDEITRSVLTVSTGSYPAWIGIFIVVCIAIIPLTKVPLNARPIVSTLELALGLDARALTSSPTLTGLSGLTRGVLKVVVRLGCTVVSVGLAILVPDFDTIMSLLGAVACFAICIILPCAFHLKLFGSELTRTQKALDWSLIVVSTALALVSTGFNLVPKSMLGM